MDIMEAMRLRHSVRQYLDKPIEEEKLRWLRQEIDACSREWDLHIQLVCEEPRAFGGMIARYGRFSGVHNYIALAGRRERGLSERAGYYGERLVLLAQSLGLNTCWVALTFSKGKCAAQLERGERLVCVVALGYGTNQGVAHKNRPLEKLYRVDRPMPTWFLNGLNAALLAPTAINQQKFRFTLAGDTVKAQSTGGFFSKVDLGIVRYHFELGAGTENFTWADGFLAPAAQEEAPPRESPAEEPEGEEQEQEEKEA